MSTSSESQFEDNSLFNFFADRNLTPIEILIDRDLNKDAIQEIFEKLKLKIGEPCSYELTEAEEEEIRKMKEKIEELEKAEKAEVERKRAELERIEKEREIEEWVRGNSLKFNSFD